MSDIECVQGETEAVCCVNAGCGNRFDPACEGFNGECDACAAVAADHFTGAHRQVWVDCPFCYLEAPVEADRRMATAA